MWILHGFFSGLRTGVRIQLERIFYTPSPKAGQNPTARSFSPPEIIWWWQCQEATTHFRWPAGPYKFIKAGGHLSNVCGQWDGNGSENRGLLFFYHLGEGILRILDVAFGVRDQKQESVAVSRGVVGASLPPDRHKLPCSQGRQKNKNKAIYVAKGTRSKNVE